MLSIHLLAPVQAFGRPCPVSSGKSFLTLCLFSYGRGEGAKLQKRPREGLGLASGPCLPPRPSALVRKQGVQLLPWEWGLGRAGPAASHCSGRDDSQGTHLYPPTVSTKVAAGGASSQGGREKVSGSHPDLPVPPRCCGKMSSSLRHGWAGSFLHAGADPLEDPSLQGWAHTHRHTTFLPLPHMLIVQGPLGEATSYGLVCLLDVSWGCPGPQGTMGHGKQCSFPMSVFIAQEVKVMG